ncbi:DUF4395 domain-containing protein [Naasia lichenicola]|uniref:DUF4395 domain-containing protein n=1 Tax=Naasia lichenicola TaxID=2565933 RepID=A0A4S4FP47_9MICO|nr:DUF4395 domain-containing protein [Naasia lichenicola]THG32299.1 DUF4395 domain-containing protein [Naasia lichenicola]
MTADRTPARLGIDPRSPRFGAAITGVLLAVTIVLELTRPAVWFGYSGTGPFVEFFAILFQYRLPDPALWLLAAISAVFAWGAFAGIRRHPYGAIFRRFIRPRLGPPTELEDAAPPTFAQGVGFVITAAGVILQLLGVPYALVIAASFAFLAAFLNSVFAFCLGCRMYLGLRRIGLLRRPLAA